MALDKRSDHIRFGSRFYIFLDWEIIEKGIGREKTHFGIAWASPRIPDVSGMLLDVSGMSGTIKTEVPLWPRLVSSSSKPPSRRLLPHLGQPRISPTKEREGDRIGEGLHQDWRPEDLISHRLLISSPKDSSHEWTTGAQIQAHARSSTREAQEGKIGDASWIPAE